MRKLSLLGKLKLNMRCLLGDFNLSWQMKELALKGVSYKKYTYTRYAVVRVLNNIDWENKSFLYAIKTIIKFYFVLGRTSIFGI